MSLLSDWLSRENFKSVTGCNDIEAYWSFEGFLWIVYGFIAAAIAAVIGTVYVVYRFWKEIKLELGYMHRYGPDWKVEFERYHGSLLHTNLRLGVVFLCLIALLVIFIRVSRRFYLMHRRKRCGEGC